MTREQIEEFIRREIKNTVIGVFTDTNKLIDQAVANITSAWEEAEEQAVARAQNYDHSIWETK